jgi:hypothetical protein
MPVDRRVLQTPMPRRQEDARSDETAEVTGSDASFREMSTGGVGPDRPDAYRDTVDNDDAGLRLEADPGEAGDIAPDRIERRESRADEEEEEREITARPSEPRNDTMREP